MNNNRAEMPPIYSVRDAVYDVMRSFGVDTLFGNPGSTELPMFRNFPQDFEYILGLQEAAVVGMADGYAQANGKIAFVNLHSAAGVGNAMGNIYTAMKNRTPMVIIAGQQARSILPFDPYLASEGATELPKPYVKWSIEPARACDLPLALATACHRALQEPCGPVLISVPSDDWDKNAVPVSPRTVTYAVRPDLTSLERLSSLLSICSSPAIVIGAEADRCGAWNELIQFAEVHRAAVYTAPMCSRATFPEDHHLFQGFLPAHREQIVGRLGGHDLVIVLGAPVFTYHVEGTGPHIPDETVLCQITEDPHAASRASVGSSIIGNVRLALQELLRLSKPTERSLPTPRAKPIRAVPTEVITTAYLLQTISELRMPTDIIVEEAPTARVVMHEYLPIVRPGTFFTMASGGLGYSMPAAVGIAMAKPKNKVIALIGDGSAMYSIQAIWSAAQKNLNLTFIIINNGHYGAMKRFGKVLGFPQEAVLPGCDLPGLDFVSLGKGMGCDAIRVDDAEYLREVLDTELNKPGLSLIEVIVAK